MKKIIHSKIPFHFFDYSESNIKILKERYGIISTHLPYKYRDIEINYLKQIIKETPKQYDLAFIGPPLSKRRIKIIDILKNLGVTINIIEGWKQERDTEIAKCKALLNIHFNDDFKIFEEIRCNRWLMAGLTVISEHSLYQIKNDNLKFYSYDELPYEIIKYLDLDKTTKIKIGVAIPTHKKDLIWLKRCLDSIEKQILKPIIVSISASSCIDTDIQQFHYSFPIHIVTTIEKQNAATNRNIAASFIKNVDIISFFDSDDEMLPERLLYIARSFSESKCDFILHNFYMMVSYKDNIKLEKSVYENYPNAIIANPNHCGVIHKMIKGKIAPGHISVSSSLWTTEKFQTEEKYIFWEDSEYARRLITNSYIGNYLRSKMAIYHNYNETYEHFYTLAKEARINSNHKESYDYITEALTLSNKENDYLIYYELSIIAYYVNQRHLGLFACDKVLFSSHSSESIKQSTIKNSIFYIEKISIKEMINNHNIITINSHKMDNFENSSPLITYKNGYLCTALYKISDEYFHRFLYFDTNLTLSYISKVFELVDIKHKYFNLEYLNTQLLIKTETATYTIDSNVVNEYLLHL